MLDRAWLDRASRTRIAILALCFFAVQIHAQSNWPARSMTPETQAVEYLFPEQVTIPAGKVTSITLHFRIREGLHINSHTPKDEFLVPTVFSIPESSGVRLNGASYPAGIEMALPIDPKEKLSVYAGEFTIEARIVAQPGNHLVEAKLRYQACDQNACLPPRSLNVPIDVIGK